MEGRSDGMNFGSKQQLGYANFRVKNEWWIDITNPGQSDKEFNYA